MIIKPTPFEPLEANMIDKQRKTDEQLDYVARTTLSERVNDYLMVLEMEQNLAKPNIFVDSIPVADVIWSDIQIKGVN
jgi:hypothetical protein